MESKNIRNIALMGHGNSGKTSLAESMLFVTGAIDENREPIPGLFVTGDCSGGFFVNNYPCLMAGIAMGRTMTFAIKAVKVAFGEE